MMRLYRVWTKAKRQSWVAALFRTTGRARYINNLIAEDYTERVAGDLTILSTLTEPTTVAKWVEGKIQKWVTVKRCK